MSNLITYSIAREWLRGVVGTEQFSFRAWSGGGRGRTGEGADHSPQSYDVFRKEKGEGDSHIHGGPLPPGIYICNYVAHHPKFHECIFLEQTITALFTIDASAKVRFYDRDSLYIHGRGPHGSDACIVPEHEADRKALNKAIKNTSGAVMLKVIDPGMPVPAERETSTSYA